MKIDPGKGARIVSEILFYGAEFSGISSARSRIKDLKNGLSCMAGPHFVANLFEKYKQPSASGLGKGCRIIRSFARLANEGYNGLKFLRSCKIIRSYPKKIEPLNHIATFIRAGAGFIMNVKDLKGSKPESISQIKLTKNLCYLFAETISFVRPESKKLIAVLNLGAVFCKGLIKVSKP